MCFELLSELHVRKTVVRLRSLVYKVLNMFIYTLCSKKVTPKFKSQFLEKVQRRLSDSSKSLHCNECEVVQWRQTAILWLLFFSHQFPIQLHWDPRQPCWGGLKPMCLDRWSPTRGSFQYGCFLSRRHARLMRSLTALCLKCRPADLGTPDHAMSPSMTCSPHTHT